jgi:hypothetical protein
VSVKEKRKRLDKRITRKERVERIKMGNNLIKRSEHQQEKKRLNKRCLPIWLDNDKQKALVNKWAVFRPLCSAYSACSACVLLVPLLLQSASSLFHNNYTYDSSDKIISNSGRVLSVG